MRPLILIVSTVAAIAPSLCAAQSLPSKQYSIAEFLDTEQIFGASFSPDGNKILVTSDRTGILNAFALPVDGGGAIPLTESTTESILARSYFPHDERILYEADRGGNELNHVFVRELDGTVRDLTPGENLKAAFMGWSQDRESFFVTSNERDPKHFDLYEYDTDSYARERIFENTEGFTIGPVSPNKRYIALGKVNTRKDVDLYLHDRQSGETRLFMNPDEPAVCGAEGFSKDNASVYCLTDLGSEFRYLLKKDIASGDETIVEQVDWDVMYARLSRSGDYLAVAVNEDARTNLRVYRTATGEPVDLPEVNGLSIASITLAPGDDAVAFYVEGGQTPGDLFYAELGGDTPPRQLTRRLSDAIDPRDLVEPEVVRFESFDGVEIPGVLYKPHQASPDNPAPALVYVHGGPGGQTRVGYSALIQYLVNHGYAVYGINNRGSSGYGKTFFALDDLKHGEGDLDDCVFSKRMLAGTGWVNSDRIGIIGGSYGGYMVCAALAFRPEAFDVGVNIFGVTNWVRTLKSIPPWWESARESLYAELGDPFEQEDYLRSISPLFHADNIQRPMIVLQGANDPRVLQIESDEMVDAVRANNVPVEYLVFPDEGHGFRKKANQIEGYEAILEFLRTYLPRE